MGTINRRAFLLGAAASVPGVALASTPLASVLPFASGGIVSSSQGLIGEQGHEIIVVPMSMDQTIACVVCMVAVREAVAEAVRLLSEGCP